MDEPTAAAVAYNLHHFQGVKYVLVYDIGGGTLDASVLYMNGKNVNVLGIAGDDHLGGSDFDHRMTLILEDKLDKAPSESGSSVTGADIPGCHRDSMRLLAEQAKIELSSAMSAEVRCRDDAGAVRTLSITRAEFQERSSDLFARCLEPVSKALEDQVMRPEHIDDIVLVGGTSRMPRIRELLQEYFGPTKTLHTEIDPDVTIAYGAANIVD
jgi:molecular chaperone DnaK (HSP70)